MIKHCVRKPFTVLVGILAVILLGFISFTRMSTDLLPEMELPYLIVYTTDPGASPEEVETSVTRPLEAALGTTSGLKNITSTSSENVSMIMMEFSEDTDLNGVMVQMNNTFDQLKDVLPENAGTPTLMQISADMMATMTLSVDYDGKDVQELSEFLNEELLTKFERLDGVGAVSSIGMVEDSVRITLDQKKIDALNDKVLKSVDSELYKTKKQLDDAQAQLNASSSKMNSANAQLEAQTGTLADQMGTASAEVDSATSQLNAILSEETTLTANQKSFEAEKQAYQQYADMNDQISMLAALIAVYDSTGKLPTDDLNEFDSVSALLSGAGSAISDPAKYIAENMTDEEFDAARDQVLSLVSGIGGDAADQLGSVSRTDFAQLASLTAKAATRVGEIDAELNNISTRLATISAMKPQLEEALETAKQTYAKLESSKISATLGVASGKAQIIAGQSQLQSAQQQLDASIEQFEAARDEAYKKADISGLITADMISNILIAENFDMPAGYIKQGDQQILLKVGESYRSLDEVADTILFHMDQGKIGDVRLKDVASVKFSNNAGETYAKINGNDGILLSVSKQSTASTAEVSHELHDLIGELEEQYPGLRLTPLMDQGQYIDMIVSSVLQNLIMGGILAILVLALFLKDVKPTIIVGFSIPMSVLFAIVLMYFTDITLNIISLSGLALGVGMLVDNSIVVMENIYRLRNEGMPAAKAAVRGASQVGGAIAASTLTTICVFLPLVFTDGLSRQLLGDMGLTIAYSLGASLIMALTLVPAMSSTILRNTSPKPTRWFDRLIEKYQKLLGWSLRHRFITLGIALAILIFSAVQAGFMGMTLIPEMSSEQMLATYEFDPDLDEETNEANADSILKIIQDTEGVDVVGAMDSSAASLMSSGGSDSISYYILLTGDRDNKDIAAEIRSKTTEYEEFLTVTDSAMDMSSMLSTGMEIEIRGDDLETLQSIGSDMKDLLGEVEGLEDITDGNEEADEQIQLIVDKEKAMREGLTVAQVFASVSSDLSDEVTSTTLKLDGKEYPVTVVAKSNVTTGNLMRQTVESTDPTTGETSEVRLKEIASTSKSKSMASIARDNNERVLTVSATVDDAHNIALISREVNEKLDRYEAPAGYSISITGENEQIMDMMTDVIQMILVAVALIYLIMVAQFQSLLSPFIVLFTIPLAFTGGLLALWITGMEISMMSMMGFLILAGVVVNNGIVFVDYTNQLRLDGVEKREALLRAGKARIRPILMTALTTILAMSTLALGIGSGAEMGQGMAVVIIGGLIYATLLTLLVVPVLYDLLNRRKMKKIDVGDND